MIKDYNRQLDGDRLSGEAGGSIHDLLRLGLEVSVSDLRALIWGWRMSTEDYLWDARKQEECVEEQHTIKEEQIGADERNDERVPIHALVQRESPKMQYTTHHVDHTISPQQAPQGLDDHDTWEQMQIMKGRISPLRTIHVITRDSSSI